MVSSLDILYLVSAFCIIIITFVLLVLGIELLRVVRDVQRMSTNLEHITYLLERVAQVIFPGIERVAKKAVNVEEKVEEFFSSAKKHK